MMVLCRTEHNVCSVFFEKTETIIWVFFRLILLDMRRSAAPSQLQGNPFKKPKFISPARSHPSPSEEVAKLNSDIKLFEVKKKKYREACI